MWASSDAVVTLVQSSSFQMGISSAILRFSQRWCPSARCRLAAAPKRGGHHQPGEHRRGYGYHEIRGGIGNTGGRLALCGLTGCSGTSSTDHVPAPEPASCVPPDPDLCYLTFGNRTLQFCEGAIARQNLVRWKKAICMTVLIRAARPHSGRFSPR